MKTTSPHEPGRDVALSRSPERRYKMKTTSPSQQIPSSLTELSLVDQIHTHFWTLHQTKLCNCDIPLAQGKNVVHRAMTLQDEPDRGDVRILFYRHSRLQQLDVHTAHCYPLKKYQFTAFMHPWILTPLHISCTVCAIHRDQRSP